MPLFPAHIFKAYDIRGLVASELSEELAYAVGRAFVQLLREQGVMITPEQSLVVGFDMRPTSVLFQKQVAQGILDEGVNVVEIGLCSTPLFNFACAHYAEHAGGIMITASHNPAEYNGFKLTLGNGIAVGKNNGMERLRELAAAVPQRDTKATGVLIKKNVLADYFSTVFSLVPQKTIQSASVVVDFGNGMGSVTIPHLVEQLPVKATYLFAEPDGTFPNHEANPLKIETLRDLQKKVLEVGADFGFALDGDADRIGLVDDRGEVVAPSLVGALIGLEVLHTHPGATMLYDLRSSQVVPEVWSAAGGLVEKCQVGHANIKPLMKQKNAAFAAELSLHVYYHDLFNVESGGLSLLYILALLSRTGKKLSEILAPLKKYAHSGEINFEIEDKKSATERVEEHFRTTATEVSYLDGLWMGFDWGWLNVRASNTEPVLRLNVEAKTNEEMERRVAEVRKVITG